MVYAFIPVFTLVYIAADIYGVIGSLPAMLRSVSFWIYFIIFTILNLVACTLLLKSAATILATAGVAPVASGLLTAFFSTIGTFSIIQSFSLKLANYKAVDLEQMFDRLRATVLTEAAAEKAALSTGRKLKLVNKLVAYYTNRPAQIDQDYAALMTFGGRPAADIQQEIVNAANSPQGKIPTLARTMVFTDERGARNYLAGAENR